MIKSFEKHKVLNARELHARYEIALETYVKTVNVEAQLMVLMANRYILPSALKYQKDVAESVKAVREAGGSTKEAKKLLDRIASLVDELRIGADKLAKAARCSTPPARRSTRSSSATRSCRRWPPCARRATSIELLMPHETWPLPTYREMLFIK